MHIIININNEQISVSNLRNCLWHDIHCLFYEIHTYLHKCMLNKAKKWKSALTFAELGWFLQHEQSPVTLYEQLHLDTIVSTIPSILTNFGLSFIIMTIANIEILNINHNEVSSSWRWLKLY